MPNHYHTLVTERPLHGSDENDGTPVAEVIFETEIDPHQAVAFVFDALGELQISTRGSGVLTECGEITRVQGFRPEVENDRPQWSNEQVKFWVIKQRAAGS